MAREKLVLLAQATRGTLTLKTNERRELLKLLQGSATVMAAGDYNTVFWSVAATIPRVTNGPTANTDEMPTHDIMFDTAEFSDTVSQAVGMIGVLNNWDGGTFKVKLLWTSEDGTPTNGVTWGIRARAYADDEALDQVPGTQVQVSDDLIAVDDLHKTAASDAVTATGATIEDLLYIQISRNTAHADDDLGGVAKLLGVLIQYKEAATSQTAW